MQCSWQNGHLYWWADMLNVVPQSHGPGSTQWLPLCSVLGRSGHLYIFFHIWTSSVPRIHMGINYKTVKIHNLLDYQTNIKNPESFSLIAMTKWGMSYQSISNYVCSSVTNFLLLGKYSNNMTCHTTSGVKSNTTVE